jgi:hypothetical protein
VTVKAGVVTLTGEPILDGQQDLLPVARRLIWDVDGVIDVVDKIGMPAQPAFAVCRASDMSSRTFISISCVHATLQGVAAEVFGHVQAGCLQARGRGWAADRDVSPQCRGRLARTLEMFQVVLLTLRGWLGG